MVTPHMKQTQAGPRSNARTGETDESPHSAKSLEPLLQQLDTVQLRLSNTLPDCCGEVKIRGRLPNGQ